jgi:hypothetical protein
MLTGEVFGDAGLEVVEQLCRLYEVRRFTACLLWWVENKRGRVTGFEPATSSRIRLGAPRESTVERGAGRPACAE